MLPSFSEQSVNTYLASISSDLNAIRLFEADLNADWLAAFSSRFSLTQADISLLTNFPGDAKAAILEAMAIVVRWSHRQDLVLPIPMEISGFSTQGAQGLTVEDFKIKAEGGTYYDENGVLTFTVKKVKVEAKFSLC